MKILSYNIRGLGDHSKQLDLCHLICFLCLAIIFIQETLSSMVQAITYFLDIFPMWHFAGVDAIGHYGGLLAMSNLQRADFRAHILIVGILLSGRIHGYLCHFHLLNLYALYKNHSEFWDCIHKNKIIKISGLILAGDFNTTLLT